MLLFLRRIGDGQGPFLPSVDWSRRRPDMLDNVTASMMSA